MRSYPTEHPTDCQHVFVTPFHARAIHRGIATSSPRHIPSEAARPGLTLQGPGGASGTDCRPSGPSLHRHHLSIDAATASADDALVIGHSRSSSSDRCSRSLVTLAVALSRHPTWSLCLRKCTHSSCITASHAQQAGPADTPEFRRCPEGRGRCELWSARPARCLAVPGQFRRQNLSLLAPARRGLVGDLSLLAPRRYAWLE